MLDKQEQFTIRVLGKDKRWHLAYPHSNKTLCGVDILNKKKHTVPDPEKYFSCYECTY